MDFVDLEGANLAGADLMGASLQNCKARGANFAGECTGE